MSGELADTNIYHRREEMIHFLNGQLRDLGCVPVIDLDPQFTLDYQPESGTYKFALSVYGTFVGKEHAWHTAGVTSGRQIPGHK